MLSSILTFPFHILASLVRFIFHTLRIPIPRVQFSSLNFYRPLIARPSTRSDPYTVSDRWVRSLEEETVPTWLVLGPSTSQLQSSELRNRIGTGSPRLLPDFTLGSYDEILRLCQSEIRIGCVILVSNEHDDVPDFKRHTLTDPTLIGLFHKHKFIVWGGDIREREAWSGASCKHHFPIVAFVALQPPRASSFMGASSRTSLSPSLTILSRHQGPSIPASAPTSARSLADQIALQLIPRVMPFLEGLRSAATERARERALRDEQDAAFRESVRRDQEKEAHRIEEARRTAELEKAELERKRAEEETRARIANARDLWRREFRQLLIPPDTPSNVDQIRVTIRLPDGQRLVRLAVRSSTVTSLYCYVDAHLTHTDLTHTDTKALTSVAEKNLQELIQSSGQLAEAWWGFSLFTAYPRQEIPWQPAVRLMDIEGLGNGGQIVVETRGENSGHHDDGYDTEKSE
ncbi:hypothetical protein H4582DRAFT_1948810 [Lactarius indigo]|nr:hypothetical protein H4582DRAFT_1948810 [Lactarius indigo]